MYLDTNPVIWLYQANKTVFSQLALDSLDENAHELLISPMVHLELKYLYEIGRISEPPSSVLGFLTSQYGLRICDKPFLSIIAAAENLSWTRDPFDRIITAQAAINNDLLLTKDHNINENYPHAVWS